MTNLDPHIFRAYDIRGKAHEQVSAEACLLIGQAFGSELVERYQKEHPRVVVGRDARTHGPELEAAVIEGLQSAGCHVLHIGPTPSPVNYFTICTQNLDGGIQVTASHNPAADNGLKLQIRNAAAYAGEDLQELKRRIENKKFVQSEGSIEDFDATTPYIDHLQSMFGNIGNNMHICIDTGNGIAGPVYTEVLKRIGAEVTELYTEPDGTFPNHPADPSKAETLLDLQDAVTTKNASLGLAFDGDGDRLGLVDETGQIRTADEILLLLAQDHLSRNPGAPVIFTVSNSGVLQTEIERWGGKPHMCVVGHSFVEHAMQEHSSKLGGEQSGHFFCGEDYFAFDDAMVAALWVIQILSTSETSLHELCNAFPAVYQSPERRPHCEDAKKKEVIEKVSAHFQQHYPVETMDGARIDFGDGAWAGIRMSNTSPCLSICIEARSPEKLQEVEQTVLEHMGTYEEVEL